MTISTNYGDLLKRQAWLQQAGAAHLGTCTPSRIGVALLAEIGELAQELKPEWAWWRKAGDAGQVDRDKMLGEAADVLHFALLMSLPDWKGFEGCVEIKSNPWLERLSISALLSRLGDYASEADGLAIARTLCAIVARYGFTPHDLAAAYWAKTEVNLKRWGAV